MSLTPPDVYPNAAVELDGNGTVVSSDGSITLVAREDGKVDTYTTSHFMENAAVPEPPAQEDQEPPAPTQAGSATIGTAPVTEPAADPAHPGAAVDPVNEPAPADAVGVPAAVSLDEGVNTEPQTDSERSVDEQIADARAKLAELEAEKNSNPDGSRSQSN